jgi:hypothetical protein
MGLQVRLAHSLGERLIDLDEIGADRPIVVGRSSEAHVQVPSVGVGRRHFVLYVEDGKWMVQDGGGTGGTYVNGERLKGKRAVGSGDVIKLGGGADAPTLTIDPHGFGSGSQEDDAGVHVRWQEASQADPGGLVRDAAAPRRESELPAASPPPVAPAVPPSAYPGGYSVPRAPAAGPVAYSPPGAGYPLPPPPQYAPPAQEAQDWPTAQEEWAQSLPPAEGRYYVPRRKNLSPATLTVTVLLVLAALAGGGWLVWKIQQNQRQAARPPIVVVQEVPLATRPATTATVTAPGRVAPPPMTSAQPTETKEPEFDPRREEESWKAVERARFEDPVIAIVKFVDYLEQKPDTPFRKDVDQYIDEALDRIWWVRVKELFEEIDDAKAQIARRQEDLKLAKEDQFKRGLQQEIKQWTEARDLANDRVRNQMKYTAPEPPNLYDSARLAHLRSQRSTEIYLQWKTQVFDSIKRTRGQRLPWKQTK